MADLILCLFKDIEYTRKGVKSVTLHLRGRQVVTTKRPMLLRQAGFNPRPGLFFFTENSCSRDGAKG